MARLVLTAFAMAVTLATGSTPPAAGASVPRPDHVVVVVMENRAYQKIIGSSSAPYINELARSGATFTRSYGVIHPSQPNYLALFSGSTQGAGDSCPHTYSKPNLGRQLLDAGLSFVGYSEGMPKDGYTGCKKGRFVRKHSPWINFPNLPAAVNLRFSRFPTDFSTLPTVAFVTPDMCNDTHDCSRATGDAWLRQHIDPYVQWAMANNSLLVLTFDEDDNHSDNHIPTVFVGPMVAPGKYSEKITHYNVLRTIEDMYGLAPLKKAGTAAPIIDVWR
jgi:hypothetical protein